MVKITLTNWERLDNNCVPILESLGCHISDKCRSDTVPPEWRAALHYLKIGELSITKTDQTYLRKASIWHIVRRFTSQSSDPVPLDAIDTVMQTQTLSLCDGPIIEWLQSVQRLSTSNIPSQRQAARDVLQWSQQFTSLQVFAINDFSVMRNPRVRRSEYTALRKTAFGNDEQPHRDTWATDGSSFSYGDETSSTTAAVVGPQSASFKIVGQYSSSLHGEMLALCAALAVTANIAPIGNIISDHLNTVNTIARVRQPAFVDDSWRYRPAHEYHRLLRSLLPRCQLPVSHVKAHTDHKDTRSALNSAADDLARRAHMSLDAVFFPPPTAYMRSFVPYRPGIGYIPDNWLSSFEKRLQVVTYNTMTDTMQVRMQCPHTQAATSVPTYFYAKSLAVSTVMFQLVLQTGQFTTNKLESRINPTISQRCDFCGEREQTEHHLFAACPLFDEYRADAIRRAIAFQAAADPRENVPQHTEHVVETDTESFAEFAHITVHGTIDHRSRFWLGIIPRSHVSPSDARTLHHLAVVLTTWIAARALRERRPEKIEDEREYDTGDKIPENYGDHHCHDNFRIDHHYDIDPYSSDADYETTLGYDGDDPGDDMEENEIGR